MEGDGDWIGEEARVRVCIGNSNYGRLYVLWNEEYGEFLNDEETKTAFELFHEIWATNEDNKPFNDQF